jgi:hypothetical protein
VSFTKHYLCDQIKDDKVVGHMAYMRVMTNMYRVLVIEPAGKKPFGKPTHRWKDNIKHNLMK